MDKCEHEEWRVVNYDDVYIFVVCDDCDAIGKALPEEIAWLNDD